MSVMKQKRFELMSFRPTRKNLEATVMDLYRAMFDKNVSESCIEVSDRIKGRGKAEYHGEVIRN